MQPDVVIKQSKRGLFALLFFAALIAWLRPFTNYDHVFPYMFTVIVVGLLVIVSINLAFLRIEIRGNEVRQRALFNRKRFSLDDITGITHKPVFSLVTTELFIGKKNMLSVASNMPGYAEFMKHMANVRPDLQK